MLNFLKKEWNQWNEMQKYAFLDGIFYAFMLGFGEKFIIPFALKSGATNLQISLLNSLIYILGGIASVLSVEVVRLLNSRRDFLIKISFLHSILWIFLAIVPFYYLNPFVVIILYVLNYSVHSLIIPIWTSLVGDGVKLKAGHYFGIRTSTINLLGLLSTYLGARILEINPIYGFSLLFFFAGIARFIQGIVKTKFPDLPYKDDSKYNVKEFLHHITSDNFGIFVMFQFFFYFSIFLASPFFVPFLFNELKLTYVQYAIIVNILPVASILLSPFFGKLGDVYGERIIFVVSSFLIPFIPLFWAFCKNFYHIFIVEIFSGIVWSAFNISTSNFLYSSLDSSHRARGVAYLMLIRGIGISIGSLLGGLLITSLPLAGYAIKTVFVVSSITRFATAFLFVRRVKEVKKDVKKVVLFNYIHNILFRKPLSELGHKVEFYFKHHFHHNAK